MFLEPHSARQVEKRLEMKRPPQQPPPQHEVRERLDSFEQTPTHLLTLSPALLQALRQIAPVPRPRKLRYALALATVGSIAWASGQRLHFSHEAMAQGAPSSAMTAAEPKGGSTTVAPSASSAHPSTVAAPAEAPAPAPREEVPRQPTPKPSKATKPRTKQAPR